MSDLTSNSDNKCEYVFNYVHVCMRQKFGLEITIHADPLIFVLSQKQTELSLLKCYILF